MKMNTILFALVAIPSAALQGETAGERLVEVLLVSGEEDTELVYSIPESALDRRWRPL